jgi:hypothetical protein
MEFMDSWMRAKLAIIPPSIHGSVFHEVTRVCIYTETAAVVKKIKFFLLD